MSAVGLCPDLPPANRFERLVLRTSVVLDRYVAARLARRGDPVRRRALTVQERAAATRTDAQARGSAGILPR